MKIVNSLSTSVASNPEKITPESQITSDEVYRTVVLSDTRGSDNITLAQETENSHEETNFNSVPTIQSVSSQILLAQSPEVDAYIQPEINEIANGFLGKIVSVVPGIIQTQPRLIRPIIVSEGANITRNVHLNKNSSSDQATNAAQLYEFRQVYSKNDLKSDEKNETIPEVQNENLNSEYKKPFDDKVEVFIEPQMVEEQAIFTTNVDITKSLPLTVNFVPEVDNNLHEIVPGNSNPSFNVPQADQQVQFLPYQNTLIPGPQQPISSVLTSPRFIHLETQPVRQEFQQPLINPTVFPGFHYVPLPILQHQPNLIPLNYPINVPFTIDNGNHFLEINNANQTATNEQIIDQDRNTEDSAPKREFHLNETPSPSVTSSEHPERKLVKYRSTTHQANYPPQLQKLKRLLPLPYATNISAAHLIPYVKQITNSPNIVQTHPYAQYLTKQQRGGPEASVPVLPHSVAYNVKFFHKDNRVQQKSLPPFKPSHPLWDSIYPPSHMYYVPYYVFDKIHNDRRTKDFTSKRNNRHLRRLYVEYGGFKPPMIPSTLLKVDDDTDKTKVPKESHESS